MTEQALLVPNEQYLKAGIHIGTKFRTSYMDKFIYKTRPDGLSVLNLTQIDERLRLAAKLLGGYAPEDIVVVCRRENGWKPLKLFGEETGIGIIAGRYPPGLLTNPALSTYREAKIMLVSDSWPDRNAVNDALSVGVVVIALCDTNNQSNDIDLVVPCNNKGKKSLGLIYWILAREYLKSRGVIKTDEEFSASLDQFWEE